MLNERDIVTYWVGKKGVGKAESKICSVKSAVIIVLANFLRFAVSNHFPPLFISILHDSIILSRQLSLPPLFFPKHFLLLVCVVVLPSLGDLELVTDHVTDRTTS